MNIKTLIVGPIQACCYVINFDRHPEALVIDAGGDGEKIIQYLNKHSLKPVYLVNTHGHIDHIGANRELKEAFPEMVICIHPADALMLTMATKNLSPELGFDYISPSADKLLEEGNIISIAEHNFRIIHTPGHTPGGLSLIYESSDNNQPVVIFTGDTLFQMGVGRTDFPGGSMQKLINSIRQKILTLPDDTMVYPGHGPATTVGDEKRGNPFLF